MVTNGGGQLRITYASKRVERFFEDYGEMKRKIPEDWVRTVKKHTIQFRLPHPIQWAGVIVLKDLFFAVDSINQIHNPVGGVFHGGGNGGQCEVCFSAACWCFDDVQFVL